MRARNPDTEGYVERNGVKIFYEVFGTGELTIFFLPTWSIIHSRNWKLQVPYFARHYRVLICDGRGNGRSDRPTTSQAYSDEEFAADALAVMDATGTEQAVLVSISAGSRWALLLAAEHPDRILSSIFITPSLSIAPGHPEREVPWDKPLESTEGWAKFNRHYWQKDYRDFLEFFFAKIFTEPHSTKQIEDCVGWGLETTPETLILTVESPSIDETRVRELCAKVRCPVLVIHGSQDAISPLTRGEALAHATGGTLITMKGAGHAPHARDPVKVNLLIRDFVSPSKLPRTWHRAKTRRKRVLYISSPIGLGHAQRDLAIADELRKLHPGLEIVWLAQHPLTEVLRRRGETIHPASTQLSNESSHIESESTEHELHIFQVWRQMDEILLSNFMIFLDIVQNEDYDLWIGNEAWELDYFLHENPEEKRAPYVWMTDFVGWLPMSEKGEREQFLTADYNAEMIEHIARFPRVRDLAILIGNPDDIISESFGPELPWIREWTEQHYTFAGYVTGFNPQEFSDREALRDQLGYLPGEKVCIVTVGGSGVGGHLLHRVIASFSEAKRLVPELRMIMVTGPRIDPESLPKAEGLEIRSYVPKLYRHLAACDLAIVQGGLTTTMELTACKRPFLYFPLRNHFEQNFHVRYRLDRYRAGRVMDFETATPKVIADAIVTEIGRHVDYNEVETDGAAKAAAQIAELL